MTLTDMARSIGRLEGRKSADRLVGEGAVHGRVPPGEELENDGSHPSRRLGRQPRDATCRPAGLS